METVSLSKGEKAFSHEFEFSGMSNTVIISCQVSTSDLFTEVLSEKEVAVFGYYDLIICYSNISKRNTDSYKTNIIRKAFCEIVPYEELAENDQVNSEEIGVIAVYLSQPTCISSFTRANSNVLFKIEVSGEIKVTVHEAKSSDEKLDSGETENVLSDDDNDNMHEKISDSEINREKTNPENGEIKNTQTKVWQFEANGNHTIEELMEMDWESLKRIGQKTNK